LPQIKKYSGLQNFWQDLIGNSYLVFSNLKIILKLKTWLYWFVYLK
jgi:hypothetical protein